MRPASWPAVRPALTFSPVSGWPVARVLARARSRARAARLGEARKVLVGKDGWLFLQEDENDVIGQHTGRVRLGRRRARAWEFLLRRRVALLDELSIPWACLIAPDKEAVYAEQLPPEVVPAQQRPIHEILGVAHRVGAPLRYPLDELVAAKGERPVYYTTDTHWNQLGAYAAYRVLCADLRARGVDLPVLEEDRLSWVEERPAGDLGAKLDPPVHGQSFRAELREHTSRLVFDNEIPNHGRVMVFESAAKGRPTCVAFGESFGNHLLLFLKESFSRLVYVHTSMIDRVRLENERPDVVLSLPVERFMIRVPDDRDASARLQQLAARKAAQGLRAPDRFLRGIPRG